MAINLNDNFKINVGNPIDSRYLNTGNTAYVSTGAVTTAISISQRYSGLTVLIQSGTTNVEYWFRDGVGDVDLIEKKYESTIPIEDFVTGATNIGFFSGQTGIQTLTISTLNQPPLTNYLDYVGQYNSLYNWFYRGDDGAIHVGEPNDGISKRGYLKSSYPVKSWIWNDYTGGSDLVGWILIDGNINNMLGTFQSGVVYYTGASKVYTQTSWSVPDANGSSVAINNVGGSLTTGATFTIGGPVYAKQEENELHFRTIKSASPVTMNISYDEAFVYISGATAVLTAQNTGTTGFNTAGVYAIQTDNTLYFRRIVGSGDTLVSEVNGDVVLYSSGGTGSILVQNVGTGAGEVYSGTTGTTMLFRTILGSGDTTVTTSGDTIIVNTEGGGVFTDDITVSLDGGKTFGKYGDGEVIPASGKTANEVIILATFEAIDPTANLSSSGNNVAFGESGKTVNLNFSYTINTPGASVASASLQYYSGSTWIELTGTTTTPDSFTHNIDDSANRFVTGTLQYRYIVVDSAGATGQTTHNVARQTYAAPSMSITLGGSVTSPETQNSREKGNVTGGTSSGSITSNRSLVDITDWTLERRYDGGSYIILASGSSLSTQSVSVPSTPDNTIPTSATSIDYKLTYVDEYTSGEGGTQSITFKYFSYWGFNTNTTINSTQIQALANNTFLSSVNLTWNNVNTPSSNYTYYAYPNTYSDITSIIKNGVVQDVGAWAQLSEVSVTNAYGESLNYKVWKTNATQAYLSTDSIVIT